MIKAQFEDVELCCVVLILYVFSCEKTTEVTEKGKTNPKMAKAERNYDNAPQCETWHKTL